MAITGTKLPLLHGVYGNCVSSHSSPSSHLQEPHHKCIGEDEFLLAESEFDVYVSLVVVDFNDCSFAEFLMGNDAANSHSFQLCH